MKKNLLLIFGGISPEHEISIISAKTVYNHLDLELYEPLLIGISKTGIWHIFSPPSFLELQRIDEFTLPSKPISLCLTGTTGLYYGDLFLPIDCAFPILHGMGGEDGSIQGLLESAAIPYVGCNVETSSLCMNKIHTKVLLEAAGLPTTPYVTVNREDFLSPLFNPTPFVDSLDLPLFVKAPHGGSSIGVIKVERPDQLHSAIESALKGEQEVLIERALQGREIECSVLTRQGPHDTLQYKASLPGEIKPKRAFYDYTAKYLEDSTTLCVPADLSSQEIEKIQTCSIQAAKLLHCRDLSRVDLFLLPDHTLLVNEINTIPGFTAISMYPSLWEATGFTKKALLELFIQSAMERKESHI